MEASLRSERLFDKVHKTQLMDIYQADLAVTASLFNLL